MQNSNLPSCAQGLNAKLDELHCLFPTTVKTLKFCFGTNESIEKYNQIVVRFTMRIIRQKIFMHELWDSKYAWQLKIRFKLTDST